MRSPFATVIGSRAKETVLDYNALQRAITIQQKSYRLLCWIADATDSGRLPVQFASRHAEGPEAAVAWVRRYHHAFPREVQVGSEDVDVLARFFWTYVITSFDIVEDPGSRGQFRATGCTCELCVRLVAASHLKVKKLRAFDKQRAIEMMIECTMALAAQQGWDPDEHLVRSCLEDPATRRAMAYAAYGVSLLERLRGETEGTPVLALWREIAWTRNGAPIRDFELRADDFVDCEQKLLQRMHPE